MFKLTPSINSQRSTPKSIRRLSSINHSKGDILMNEYFNLPMISTKSTIGNNKNNGFKPNTISVIEDLNRNNHQYSQKNPNIPLKQLLGLTEKDQECQTQDLLEKYYQNKKIVQERNLEKRKQNRIQIEEKSSKQRCYSLYQTNVQNFDNSTESLKHSLRRYTKIEEDKYNSISLNQSTIINHFPLYQDQVIFNHQIKENERLRSSTNNSRRKLKAVFLFVFSSMVISKNYSLRKKEEKKTITLLNKKLQSCQKVINSNGIKSIEAQQQQFVQIISNKVVHYLKSQTYIDECNSIDEISNPIQNKDWKKLRVQCFSRLIYQNLELLTRECNIPELIKCQLIASLFKTSKQETSYFVGERCHFYQANKIHIEREQKLAIATEFLLFQIIIPNLLQIVNNLPTYNQKYKIQTQQIIVIIASLLHKQFVNRFQNMRKLKNPNGNMVYKKLSIQYQKDGLFCNEINIQQNTGDNNEVLEGLLQNEKLEQLEGLKPIWKEQLDTLFEKILQNVETLINF
ncbi:unnamed protein product [Paramecium sonneborni]|uniref:Uncharacterized protein n=1 Tax=Paramecium sonneborni TaxID=65129 RepID=A0A8S1P9C0_9CILI|nr:unnamed protein product [Paramecium sonneborni]